MKKIVLIGFLSVLCLDVFSQVTSLDLIEEIEKRYANAETTDEKLDVIFHDILEKQISDYKEMEKENKKLQKKINQIKQASNNKNLKALETSIDSLYRMISELKVRINNKEQKISTLERNKEEVIALRSTEKARVEAEIKQIFEQKYLISINLLKRIKKRASDYKIEGRLMSDLNTFIDVSKKIIQAQNLLSKRLNISEVESQLNILNNIRNNKFNFLNIKIKSLIILLEEYCDKSQKLFDDFETVDNSVYTDEVLKDLLSEERSLFISFPFLFDEISKKIKDINYKSQLQECY